ncbi:MAG: isoprenyl transferase [Alphaproteobacteria bacterium]
MLEGQQIKEPEVLPRHIAIIMDGNGRWARERRRPRVEGHRQGADAVRRTVEACREIGISCLTLFAFSSENWNRSADEVDDLMGLLRHYLKREVNELAKNGIMLRVIGDRSRLAKDIIDLIEDAESRTATNTAMRLTIAVSYGAQAEIARAARDLAAAHARGEMELDDIDEAALAARLYTADIPDPDLIIRTSGEQRLSNFMLWQSAYAELLFVGTYWPDFDKTTLLAAVEEFRARERRYGARPVC